MPKIKMCAIDHDGKITACYSAHFIQFKNRYDQSSFLLNKRLPLFALN